MPLCPSQFLAYLRLAQAKARAGTSAADQGELVERLAARFTAAYTAAGGDPAALERVALYESLCLVRQAAHAWQNLKGARLEHLLTLLAERVPPTTLQQRRSEGLQGLAAMPDKTCSSLWLGRVPRDTA